MEFMTVGALSREGETGLLKGLALLKALPDGFALRSHAAMTVHVDPALTPEAVVAEIKGYASLLDSARGRTHETILGKDGTFLLVHMDPGTVRVEAVSSGLGAREALEGALSALERHRFENEEEDGVWVDFTHQTSHGVARNTEFIRCPKWEEIEENYPRPVQNPLGRLMEMEDPWKRGRLIIWYGPPGTGKTYAIRALLMRWRKKFDFLVVTDPERLASSPSYYYEVASETCHRPRRHRPRSLEEDVEEDEGSGDGKKRSLFIFEDSADLIIQESRSRHWDKIGKLLNITDGLLGQGREDLFLVTFNEDLTDIDPAFVRPGRCVDKLKFEKFKAEAARDWLAKKRVDGVRTNPFKEDLTLAELYARLLAHPAAAAARNGTSSGF